MAYRDGLKPASAYPEAIYLQRTHEDGSEMLYPHDATWTETSDCGYDIKYIRADIASPQPAPHAMVSALSMIKEFHEWHKDHDDDGAYADSGLCEKAIAVIDLLAQPAAVEPAKPDFYISKDRRYARVIIDDLSDIPESRHGEWRACFFDTAPSPGVAEPARKAIDAQGAGQCEKCGASTCEIAGIEGVVICDICHTVQEAKALPPPAATLGKADGYEHRKAIAEAECIGASDDYFKARTHLMDTVANRNIFEAGFNRGFDKGAQQPAASDVRDDSITVEERIDALAERAAGSIWGCTDHNDDVDQFTETSKSIIADAMRELQSTPAVQADEGKS